MVEVACFEGLGVRSAVVEVIHRESLTPGWCGTGMSRALQDMRRGCSHPSFIFQVAFL